jgi:CubicO group peptidase (beta-lactamase class C family)
VRARILAPLGLENSGMADQAMIVPRLALTYYWREDQRILMNDLPVYFQNLDAAGGMYSTVDDLHAFAEALYGGQLLLPGSLELLLTPGLDDYGYGLWSYDFERGGHRHRVAKRPGSSMGANAVLYRLLDEQATVVILANTNRTDLDAFAQRIGEWVLDSEGE